MAAEEARPEHRGRPPQAAGTARRGRPQATDSAETRRRILSAARVCFGGQGYDRTTNKDIAAAAGITQAAIYHYFPSKQDVFVAAFRELQSAIFPRFEAAVEGSESLTGQVKAFLDTAAEIHADDRTLATFMAIAPLEIRRHPELRRTLGEDALAAYEFFERLVAGSPGDLEPDIDPASVVYLLLAVSTGFAQFGATTRSGDAHRLAIESFGRLLDGTLITSGRGPAEPLSGNGRRRRPAAAPLPPLDGNDTRRRILAAARTCFGDWGYDVTTNKDIGAAAGLTAGAIYRYFPSKQDLFLSVYREVQGFVFADFEKAVVGRAGLADRVKAILDRCGDMHALDRSLASFSALAPIEIQRHPEIRAVLGAEALAVRRFFERLVRETADDLAPDVRPDSVVNLLVALITGLASFGATTRTPRPHRDALATCGRLVDGTLFASPGDRRPLAGKKAKAPSGTRT